MKNEPQKTRALRNRPRSQIISFGFGSLFVAIALVTVLALHSNQAHQQTKIAIVRITKAGFEPATLSVKQGTKIVWDNSDSSLHQVASNPYPKDTGLPGLKSAILNNAQSYSYTANAVGTFGYHDQLTPTINGTLVVQK